MKEMPNILMVEDDPILGKGLFLSLELEGYKVEWGKSFKEGLDKFSNFQFDLVVLDIGLPDKPGTELCRAIREKDSNVGIIFLTAKTDEETVVSGLELGANDFVKKPFSHKELMARVKVLLRAKLPQTKELKYGELYLSQERREVRFQNEEISLNRRQFDILSYFMSHPNQIVTREQLLSSLEHGEHVFDRTVDSHLSQLRRILKKAKVANIQIVSIYGVGYRLETAE